MMTKADVRRQLRKSRRDYPNELRINNSEKIALNLFESAEYKSCDMILIFISTRIEVDTSSIFAKALSDGKICAAPRCESVDNKMDFFVIESIDDLESGAFEIMEPKQLCPVAVPTEKSLLIAPGLSFDKSGQRMGFGRGYYDRYLADFKGISCGVCFDEFVSEQLPAESTDIPVNMIVTQSKIIRI